MPDNQKLISDILDSIEQVFENDTEQSLKQLENLRQINTSTTLKFIKKEEELKSLSRKTLKIEAINNEINELLQTLDKVEKKVDFLENLTKELDEYTKTL